jgi:hypothetical protein
MSICHLIDYKKYGVNRNYQLFIPATLFPITQTAAAILYAVSLLFQGAFCLW